MLSVPHDYVIGPPQVSGIDEATLFITRKPFNDACAYLGPLQLKRTADLLGDVAGLIIAEMMTAPEFLGGLDDGL